MILEILAVPLGLVGLFAFYIWWFRRPYSHIPGVTQIAPLTPLPLPEFLSPYYNARFLTSSKLDPYFATIAKDGMIRITAAGSSRIYVRDPELVKDIALKRPEIFAKPPVYDIVSVFGENIVSANGNTWKKHRTVADPAFAENHFNFLIQETCKSTNLLIERMEKRRKDNRLIIDPHIEMQDVTLDIIGKVAFGYDLGIFDPQPPKEPHKMTFEKALKLTMTLGLLLHILLPKYLYFLFPQTALAIEETEKYMRELIQRRINDKYANRFDLLSLLVSSNLEQIEEISLTEDELVADIFIFLIAGHETSATTIQWILYELAIHPDIQQKAYDEVVKVIGNANNRTLNLDDYSDLFYLRCIVQESLRLHPPVANIPKMNTQTTKLGKYTIPANTEIYFDTVGVHRDPNYWTDPLDFKPERFDMNSSVHQKRHPCSLIPFNVGARKCIGFKFSEIETAMILAYLLVKYEFVLPKDDPKMQTTKVLKGEIDTMSMVTQRPYDLRVEFLLRQNR